MTELQEHQEHQEDLERAELMDTMVWMVNQESLDLEEHPGFLPFPAVVT